MKGSGRARLGDLEFHILLALGRGEAHGYAIGKEMEERTGGRVDPTTGALYQALRRLAESGLIEAVRAPSGESDARRKYFRVTASGRRAASAEAERLDSLVALAREKRLYPARP